MTCAHCSACIEVCCIKRSRTNSCTRLPPSCHAAVPNVEFLLNVDDYPKATQRVRTSVERHAPLIPLPLFSYAKLESRDNTRTYRNYDVLVPSGAFRMSLFEYKLLQRTVSEWQEQFPWSAKRPVAYFRGTPYCSPKHAFHRCSRYVLARLSHENRSEQLDVGLVEYNPSHDTELRRRPPPASGPLRKAPRQPESTYTGFKFLLHMDGHSFSNRLQVTATAPAVAQRWQASPLPVPTPAAPSACLTYSARFLALLRTEYRPSLALPRLVHFPLKYLVPWVRVLTVTAPLQLDGSQAAVRLRGVLLSRPLCVGALCALLCRCSR